MQTAEYQNEWVPTSTTFITNLTAGDYITFQILRQSANLIINETTMNIVKLEGVEGPQGPQGLQGIQGPVGPAGPGDFSEGGEFGTADRTLGNTDTYDLGLLTDGQDRLHIESGGNVGIGTTTPDTKLEVNGIIKLTPQGSAPTCNVTTEGGTYYDDFTDHAYLCDGNNWNQIDGGAGGGGDFADGGDIVVADRSLGNQNAFDLSFLTSNLTRLFIEDTGNVGIGTMSPSTLLEVAGIIKTTPQGSAPTCDANAEGGVYYNDTTNHLYVCDGSTWQQADGMGGGGDFSNLGEANGIERTLGNTDAYDLGLLTDNTTRLHIESTGEVGIGVTSPATKLDIDGPLRTAPQVASPTCDVSMEGGIFYDDSSNKFYGCNGSIWELLTGGGGGAPLISLSSVQARRTSTYNLVDQDVWYDIPLNITDVETDIASVEHNDTNQDNIDIKVDGLYMITYHMNIDNNGTSHLVNTRVQKNNTVEVSGSYLENSDYENEVSPPAASFIVNLTAGDYVTLQALRSTPNVDVTEVTFTVVKLDGIKGDAGDPVASWNDIPFRDRRISLSPEYDGAVFQPDGSNNIGYFDAGHDSSNFHNAYLWRTTQTSLQDYDIVVRYQLPDDFNSWDPTSPITFEYKTATTLNTDNKLDLKFYDTANVEVAALSNNLALVSSTADTWTTYTATDDINSGHTWIAGDWITLKIKNYADDTNNGAAYAGELILNYRGK